MKKRYVRKVLEKDVEGKANTHGRSLRLKNFKFKSANNRAVPDRIYIGYTDFIEEITFFIEYKRPGIEKADELQEDQIEIMRKHGAKVFVTNDLAVAKQIMDDMVHFGETTIQNNGKG